MTKAKFGRLVAGVVLVLVITAPTQAQNVTDVVELTKQAAETQRQAVVTTAMQFTEAESVAFWPVYHKYRADMLLQLDRLITLARDYAENMDNLSDEQAAHILDQYLDIELKSTKVKRKYVKQYRKVLPEKQVTRFYQIDNKLDAIVRFDAARTVPLVE